MDDQSGDSQDPPMPRAQTSSDLPRAEVAEFELRLRSTERVRTVIRRSCVRCSAPDHLVVRIRESLVIVRR